MTPTEKNVDIIDAAMSGDDYDYGDKEPDNTTGEDQDDVQVPEQTSEPGQQGVSEPATPQTPAGDRATQPTVQQPTDPSNPLGLKRVGAQFADGKGNIVDKEGKIVARAGEAARLWQEASRANAQVNNLTRNNTALMRELEDNRTLIAQAKEIAELPSKLGISKEDYNEGITLLSQWNKNPVEVAREIVARAVALGYNVTDILGKSAGDAIETRAIAHLVNQATAPLKQQQEEAARAATHTAATEKAYNTFLTNFPDAEIHGNEIANLMQKGRTPEVAYYQVKMFAMENGLDFNQPLGPQVAAMQRNQGQRPTEQRRAPLNPGNGRGNESQMTTQTEMADAGDSWGDILTSVMKQTDRGN